MTSESALRSARSADLPMLTGPILIEIANERARQVEQEGWTPEHDDTHADGSLAAAAGVYAIHAAANGHSRGGEVDRAYHKFWPWDAAWWRPTNRRRALVKAAALIVAEIERIDRAGGAA